MKNYPNILIVKGTGRNVGKTLSTCRIIENLADKNEVVAVKISPHFHELDSHQKFIYQSEDIVILEEKNITHKDSSRMLQAGAKKVFYVQTRNQFLPVVIDKVLKDIVPNQPVVIETGGLYDFIEPGLLLYIAGKNPKNGKEIRKETRAITISPEEVKSFNWDLILFKNGKFYTHA